MNKFEFLSYLRKKLRRFGSGNASDAVGYYDEIISEKVKDGMSERDAVASLGSPDKIIADTVSEMVVSNKVKNPSSGALYAVGILFLSPVLIPIAIVILTLYIVIFTVWVSLTISFGAASIGVIIGGIGAMLNGNAGGGLFILGCSLIAAVIMFVLCFSVAKYGKEFINLITVKLVRKIKNNSKRGK